MDVRLTFPLAQLHVDYEGMYFIMADNIRLSGPNWTPQLAWDKALEYVINM